MKKTKFVLGSLLTISTSLAVADQVKPQRASDQVKPQPILESVVTEPTGVITPAVAPVVDGAGFFFSADFIWWKAQIGNLQYAGTGVSDGGQNVPAGTSSSKGSIKNPDFNFQPGFKVGAGLDFEHDGWDVFAEYTWLNGGHHHNHLNGGPGLGEISGSSTVVPAGSLGFFSCVTASSSWEQHLNVLDGELGRNFFISHRLTLRPFIGLKAAWIKEELTNRYLTTATNPLFATTTYNIRQSRHQHMWGIGARGGIDTVWHFNKNWGIYGDMAFTALWSDFHTRAKDRFTDVATGLSIDTVNTRVSITEINMVFETNLGLAYMTWFNDDKCQFSLRAGWEEQIWFNLNHFSNVGAVGNLTMHGLTVKAGIGF